MNFFSRLATGALALCLVLIIPAVIFADEWKPVDPAELTSKTPVVDKDADAEVLSWDVRIDDSHSTRQSELSFQNYVRIKIFTERGKDSQSKVDIRYDETRITDIAARVIRPDGSIVELQNKDIFDRVITKTNGAKVNAKSFALPGVLPGSIIEYRWREVYPNAGLWTYSVLGRMRLEFQRDIPVRQVTYNLKPYEGMRYQPFNMEAKFVKNKDGSYQIGMTNVPAFTEEPHMPPEDAVRSWLLLFKADDVKREPEKYWQDYGRKLFEDTKDSMKVSEEVKTAVAGIIGDAATPGEKLRLIYDFCRTKIKNISDDASGLTRDEKRKIKENKSPADTLKNGRGRGDDIDFLFAALAKAAGFDARYAKSANRGDIIFDRSIAEGIFLSLSFIAVRLGDNWEFFSPQEMYTDFGMLDWREEAQQTLITDPKEPIWVNTGLAAAEKSVAKRAGKFRLLDDGTLEGDVHIEYTGHLAYEKKEDNDDDSPAQREETLRDMVKGQMSTAELSDVHIENVADPLKPFTYQYHVRVPGYAQRTGKRLFIQPEFFEHGMPSVFTASDRKKDIYFDYAWSEDDDILIDLPDGYALDNADAPPSIVPANTQQLMGQTMKISVADGHTLLLRRQFFFGWPKPLMFGARSYDPVKELFDLSHQIDSHTITLKQAAATAVKN
jgi:hypothetical protein